MSEKIKEYVKLLWDYLAVSEPLEPAECIMGFGCVWEGVPRHCAKLYHQGLAPLIVFSGGFGRLSKLSDWKEPEADVFKRVAVSEGAPEGKILAENKSTNTSENITLSRELLHKNNLDPKSFIIVQFPHGTRRAKATFQKQWPDKKVIVSLPPITPEEYCEERNISIDTLIDLMVGEVDRLIKYPKMGYFDEETIPNSILNVYHELIKLGHTGQLVK